jgi:hypothetical protein
MCMDTDLLSSVEAAEYVGLPESIMFRLIRDQKVPSVPVHGVSYVHRSTLDAFQEFAQFRIVFLELA